MPDRNLKLELVFTFIYQSTQAKKMLEWNGWKIPMRYVLKVTIGFPYMVSLAVNDCFWVILKHTSNEHNCWLFADPNMIATPNYLFESRRSVGKMDARPKICRKRPARGRARRFVLQFIGFCLHVWQSSIKDCDEVLLLTKWRVNLATTRSCCC